MEKTNIVYNMDCMIGMNEYPDKYFDLAIVDPVYGGVTKGGYMNDDRDGKVIGTGKAKQKGYHNGLWQQKKTDASYFKELFRVSKNQIVWGGNYFANNLPESQCWIVWDKKHPEGIKFADGELAWTSFNSSLRIFRFLWNGMLQEHMGKDKEKRIHPTQKPVALYEWILRNYAKEGDKILDTHVGSGSSRIACAKLGFDFIGYEIDKKYFEDQEKRFKEEEYKIPLF